MLPRKLRFTRAEGKPVAGVYPVVHVFWLYA